MERRQGRVVHAECACLNVRPDPRGTAPAQLEHSNSARPCTRPGVGGCIPWTTAHGGDRPRSTIDRAGHRRPSRPRHNRLLDRPRLPPRRPASRSPRRSRSQLRASHLLPPRRPLGRVRSSRNVSRSRRSSPATASARTAPWATTQPESSAASAAAAWRLRSLPCSPGALVSEALRARRRGPRRPGSGHHPWPTLGPRCHPSWAVCCPSRWWW